MFDGCTSLTAMPELKSQIMTDECYTGMFQNCSSLIEISELPATTLAPICYSGMFENCSSLVIAPVLSAHELVEYCYQQMFYGCKNLNNIKVAFTSWPDSLSGTQNWVSGVAANGTFTCPAELPKVSGASYIPEGWTVVNQTVVNQDEE